VKMEKKEVVQSSGGGLGFLGIIFIALRLTGWGMFIV